MASEEELENEELDEDDDDDSRRLQRNYQKPFRKIF
jgi:hypothetical protein